MTDSESDPSNDKTSPQNPSPVMFCQTADGGSSKRLVRGAAPSTSRHRRKDKRRLSELMFFRCTPEDRAIIDFNAAKVGLECSAYMRSQSTGKPVMRAYRRIRADWDELRRLMGAVNRAGNVVNQLVMELRRMGRSSGLAHVALNELAGAARIIMTVLRKL